jgi:pimeloyl-ACP methyl ester carboxylesterase
VLIPDIPNLRALVISATDARVIADAIRHLAEAGGFEGERPIGLFAFSYAAGPALIAAMEADTRQRVRFVYTVGAYYSIETVVTFFTTGHFRERKNGPWKSLRPNPSAQWVFLLSNAGRLEDPRDRATLAAIAERKLENAGADVSDLAAALGPEGRSVYALLTNRAPERVPELLDELPDGIRREMRALDLSKRDFSMLEGKLILIHGRDDTMIPFTESRSLARAASHVSSLFVINSLSHVEPRFSGLFDFFKLWRAAYKILAARDAMPAPQALQDAQAFPATTMIATARVGFSVAQACLALTCPSLLVRSSQRVQVVGRRRRIVHPFA